MFSKIVAELDKKVVRMLFESYGIAKNCESYVESTTYLLRYLKYDAPKTMETSMVFPPHTDKTFTTILYPNHISGLEVQTRDGQWITLEFPPSSFVVMAGEAIRVNTLLLYTYLFHVFILFAISIHKLNSCLIYFYRDGAMIGCLVQFIR